MEQSFWQKLQRVKGKDILHLFLFLLAFPVAMIYRMFRKKLWLICDNENEARDNGYWMFRYIVKEHPKQDVVYAINKKSPDYARVRKLGEVVQFGSFKHWIYYLAAQVNISSQKEGKPNAAVCYLLEVYGIIKNKRIFLQHGITKDDMEFLYYCHTKMRLFVCAVEKEYEYVEKKFGYPKGWVQKLGFARFDNLFDTSSQREKRILLVMPTWRNWIGVVTSKSYQYEDVSEFTKTEYFKYWNDFLGDEGLWKFLENENLQLVFYPHRKMQKYLNEFNLKHPNITIAGWPKYDVQGLLKEASLLITDYSSIAMDFAYMKKPLLYYQFDYEKFRKGHYAEGYFSYEKDGFGPVCRNREALKSQLEQFSSQGYQMPPDYRKRADEFFDLNDKNNCKRNYDAIMRIAKGEG